jgi:hypothetical protein
VNKQSPVTVTWSKFRGPGDVTFSNSMRIPRDGDQRSEVMAITIPK